MHTHRQTHTHSYIYIYIQDAEKGELRYIQNMFVLKQLPKNTSAERGVNASAVSQSF